MDNTADICFALEVDFCVGDERREPAARLFDAASRRLVVSKD